MKKLKRLLLALMFPALMPTAASCGYTSRDNELVGQVKKVVARTPILCGDYYEADVSLGVLRNGGGSISHEDVEFYVVDGNNVAFLKQAAEEGFPVKIGYSIKRWPAGFCVPTSWLTSVQRLGTVPPLTGAEK